MIDVLVPVLGRPQNAQPLADSFRATAPADATLTFICSEGDDDQIAAVRATGCDYLIRDFPDQGQYARKINAGVHVSQHDWILNASDDLEFTPGWAEEAQRFMIGRMNVVATNDDLNGQVKSGLFGTHCITRRSYVIERGATAEGLPGILLHEGYDHNFVDRELCSVARHRGVYAFAKHSVIRHRHPLFRTARWDPTYRKSLQHLHQDRDLFLSRAPMFGEAGMTAAERRLATRQRRDIVRR